MGEGKHIVLLNIEHYKRLLASETDPDKREAVSRQLAEQETKLQEMEGKERWLRLSFPLAPVRRIDIDPLLRGGVYPSIEDAAAWEDKRMLT